MVTIEKLNLYHVQLPLKSYFEISSGKLKYIDTIIVQLKGNGAEGWGEAPPWSRPIYGPETATTAFKIIEEIFAPEILGKSFDNPLEFNKTLDMFKGNYFAKAAVETAFWVMLAHIEDKPLHSVLGGEFRSISCGDSIGIQDSEEKLLEEIRSSLEKGYNRIKLGSCREH